MLAAALCTGGNGDMASLWRSHHDRHLPLMPQNPGEAALRTTGTVPMPVPAPTGATISDLM